MHLRLFSIFVHDLKLWLVEFLGDFARHSCFPYSERQREEDDEKHHGNGSHRPQIPIPVPTFLTFHLGAGSR